MTERHVIGVDEVGWGCVAGPIVVCAASVPLGLWDVLRERGFRDSKKVGNKRTRYSDGKCELLARWLDENEGHATWAIAQADPQHIDDLSPDDAKNKAFRTAVLMLMHQNGWQPEDVEIIVDGNRTINTLPKSIAQAAVPKADDSIMPVAVASVLAKSYRDKQMIDLDPIYPAFGLKDHKGYPTEAHLKALLEVGPVKGLHRWSYIKKWVTNYYEKMYPNARPGKDKKLPRWLVDENWVY